MLGQWAMYLTDIEHYAYLMKKALLIQKNPVVKMVSSQKRCDLAYYNRYN
jgi:hypothetical protein